MWRDARRDLTLLNTTPLKTTRTQLRAMPPATDLHDPSASHDHAGHAHHGHAHHNHDHHDHAESGAHGHEAGFTSPGANIAARPAFRAGASLVRMSMGARLAIALCAIVALWAIVLIAMM
jgi:hypothetical protein